MIGEMLRQLPGIDPLDWAFTGTTSEAIDRYNWLLQNAPERIVPALHFTPHEFRPESTRDKAVTIPLREQVKEACPMYDAVQATANNAVQVAGPLLKGERATEFGTRIHTIVKQDIDRYYAGRLIAERSFLKYTQELDDEDYEKMASDMAERIPYASIYSKKWGTASFASMT